MIYDIVGILMIETLTINSEWKCAVRLYFAGFMQRIQQEVDLLADLVHCLDSFTQSQTRLVVVVDGLDNCERDKMVQTLDALELLFCSRQNRPFVVTIAVDPHIIISAVTNNMHTAITGTELTGYDYLKVKFFISTHINGYNDDLEYCEHAVLPAQFGAATAADKLAQAAEDFESMEGKGREMKER